MRTGEGSASPFVLRAQTRAATSLIHGFRVWVGAQNCFQGVGFGLHGLGLSSASVLSADDHQYAIDFAGL